MDYISDVLLEDLESVAKSDIPFEKFQGKTFLVTGATGLIGSLFIKNILYCSRVHDLSVRVKAVVRSVEKAEKIFGKIYENLEYIVADLEKDELRISEKCDFIVHAAAVTASKQMVTNPVGTIKTSIDGTEKILKLAAENDAHVVYISSMEVYGQPKVDGMTTEADLGYVDIASVRSCYPEGKRMCECLCTAYHAQYGVDVKSARLAQTFGAGVLPGENRVFAQFARSAMNGEDIVLHTMGESEGNYVYTTDAIRAIMLLFVAGEPGQAYNIANEESHISIRNMAQLVASRIAEDKMKVVIDIPQDSESLGYAPPVRMHLSSQKMQSLGWKPQIGLEDAYRRMMRWMLEQQ